MSGSEQTARVSDTQLVSKNSAGEPRAVPNDISTHRRIPALDGLRGVAIILVFLFHIKPPADSPLSGRVLDLVVGPWWCGVDLFFVLSGFLITGILYDTKGKQRYFINFYTRRTLRIFPLYYGVLIGLFFLLPLLIKFSSIEALQQVLTGEYYLALWNNQWTLWLYVQNFLQARGPHQLPGLGHFWSLAIEEQFYLVWPLFVFFCSGWRLFWICLAICILGPPLRWGMLEYGLEPWAIRHITFARIDALAMGGLAAIAVRKVPVPTLKTFGKSTFAIATGLTVVLAIAEPGMHRSSVMVTVAGYSVLAVLFTSVVLLIAIDCVPDWFREILTHRVLLLLGTLSYGIYIFHWPLLHMCRAVVGRYLDVHSIGHFGLFAIETTAVVFLTTCVALLSWRFFESPILSLKERFH